MIPMDKVYLGLTYDDGSFGYTEFVTVGRGTPDQLPHGAKWVGENTGLWSRDATPEEVDYELERSQRGIKFTKKIVSWRYMDFSELPESRRFRDAWKDTGAVSTATGMEKKPITVDMQAAREVHREHIRRVRETLFFEADAQLAKATETGTAKLKSAALARKQALRDATDDPRIDAAQTPEALAEAWPEALAGLEESWR